MTYALTVPLKSSMYWKVIEYMILLPSGQMTFLDELSPDVCKKRFMDEWYISEIPYQTAMTLVVKNHYMHRECPCSHAYGLINSHGEIDGVVTYGVSCSSTLLKGICGDDESQNVYELNRLWVSDSVPKNGESFLVGNTLKLLDREIIVSFADTSMGHIGYIYQATNFLYCGQSAPFKDIRVKGYEGMHHATFAHGMTFQEVEEKYGKENCYYVERPRKNRYVFFSASKKRKKELREKLQYQVQPYPKGDVKRHTADENYGY